MESVRKYCKDSLFREDCKGWLEKIAIYIGKVWVDPFLLLLLQLSIFTFVYLCGYKCVVYLCEWIPNVIKDGVYNNIFMHLQK